MGVEGPEGQDFNITYSPTIPSGLNVIFHSDQDLYILKPFTYSGEQTITLSAGVVSLYRHPSPHPTPMVN